DRDDVPFEAAVDRVDDRRERRRLARPGLPGDEDQSAVRAAQAVHDRRHIELLERQRGGRNAAEYRADAVQMPEHVHAKARDVRDRMSEIGRVVLLELLDRRAAHQLRELDAQLFRIELLVLDGDQLAVDAHTRRIARDEVQVRALTKMHAAQEIVDHRHRASSRQTTFVLAGSTVVSVTKRSNFFRSVAKRYASSGSISRRAMASSSA